MGFFSSIRNLFRDETKDAPPSPQSAEELQQPALPDPPPPPPAAPPRIEPPAQAEEPAPLPPHELAAPVEETAPSLPACDPVPRPAELPTPPPVVTAEDLAASLGYEEEAQEEADDEILSLDVVAPAAPAPRPAETPLETPPRMPEPPAPIAPPAAPSPRPEPEPRPQPESRPQAAPVQESAPPPASHTAGASPLLADLESAPPPAPAERQAEPSQSMSEEETAMALALREAEPRLSAWLAVALEGVERADGLLWDRVRFLLRSLEAPDEEIEAFIGTFRHWLEDMEYEDISEFRSELQYRLALALDLEDEEDERSRLMLKLTEGLAKTREQISRNLNTLFSAGRLIDETLWEELEEVLIMADVGYETAHALTEGLRRRAAAEGLTDASSLREAMRLELLEVFKPVRRISVVNPPEVALVIGVNGVGKTTTIAKLCHRAVLQGKRVLLVAGDTFRAAATEQLEIWAKRAGAGFYAKGHGADPAAVAYEAIDKAVNEGYDTVFVDTAGRLHTKVNLMEELTKVSRVLGKRHPGAPHRTILVLDATTGQNALAQVKLFNQACAIDELILTKLDGTAKGGIAVAVAMQYDIPISFVGLGEKMDDLRPFDAESYVTALLGLEKPQ